MIKIMAKEKVVRDLS